MSFDSEHEHEIRESFGEAYASPERRLWQKNADRVKGYIWR